MKTDDLPIATPALQTIYESLRGLPQTCPAPAEPRARPTVITIRVEFIPDSRVQVPIRQSLEIKLSLGPARFTEWLW
jgi:hypothetical protein